MKSFSASYVGKLRQIVGNRLLLVPSARAVIESPEGKILLQERRDMKIWGLPGGSADEGESIEDCLRREVKEETGLTVETFDVYGYSSDPEIENLVYPNGHEIHSHTLLFHVTAWSGELDSSNEESLRLEYFSPDALPEMLPNERLSLERYFEFKRTRKFQLV
jgi:8-oxo-dGTP pyrophosphatase MutT (NUDIX family)